MGLVWQRSPTEAWSALADAQANDIHAAVRALARRIAPQLEAEMKENARWTDRTANARQTLHTEVEEVADEMVEIILAHGVDYGIYLELSHGGAYAIIGPTIDTAAPRIWGEVVAMLRG